MPAVNATSSTAELGGTVTLTAFSRSLGEVVVFSLAWAAWAVTSLLSTCDSVSRLMPAGVRPLATVSSPTPAVSLTRTVVVAVYCLVEVAA